MKKREAAFQTKFNRWARANWRKEYPGRSCVFETKVAVGTRLNVSSISDKQIKNLRIATEVFVYKFSDMGGLGTPLDGVIVADSGYLILNFGGTAFYIIDVFNWIDWVEQGNKSITEEQAAEIGNTHYLK